MFPPNDTTQPCYNRLAREIGAAHYSLAGILKPGLETSYHIPLNRLEQAVHRLFQETP